MEMGLTGGGIEAKLEWALERLGGEIGIEDVYDVGQEVDVVAVTKGKVAGSIKRFGLKLLSHKNSKRRRQEETWETLEPGTSGRRSGKLVGWDTTRGQN